MRKPERTGIGEVRLACVYSTGPKYVFHIALTLTVFEGALRKWLIGGEAGTWSYLAYFSKDLFFGAILLWTGHAVRLPAFMIFRKWLRVGGVLFLAGAALSSLRGLNPVGALLTLRAGLILPIVALLAAQRLAGLRLEQVAKPLIVCTLINCTLGIAQSRLPAEHYLNRYVAIDASIVAVETGVRATGTFSYISGLGIMASVGLWAGMISLAFARRLAGKVLGMVAILAAFGCGLASVSRGPILVDGAMLAAWVFLSRSGFNSFSRSGVLWGPAVLLISSLGLIDQFQQLGRAVIARHEMGDDSFEQRAFGQLKEGLEASAVAPFGAGLGTEQVGGNYAASGTMRFTNFETQLPRLIMETGVLGSMGYLAICIGAILALQEARRTADTKAMDAALFATQLLLIPLFYANILFHHIGSAFGWLIFAAVLAAGEKLNGPRGSGSCEANA